MEIGSYTFHVRAINPAGTVGPESTYAFAIVAQGSVQTPEIDAFPPELDTDNIADFTWS